MSSVFSREANQLAIDIARPSNFTTNRIISINRIISDQCYVGKFIFFQSSKLEVFFVLYTLSCYSKKYRFMASRSCSFSALIQGATTCGLSSDYPGQVEVVPLRDCTRDVSGHCKLHGLSTDKALDSEYKLLLARAGNIDIFFSFFSFIVSRYLYIP